MMLPAGTRVADVIEPAEVQPTEDAGTLPRPKNKVQQLQQGIFEHVSEHIRREPAQSTRLLEAWIGSPEEKS